MSPAASSVRSTLFVQAAVTLLFGLLRPGASPTWTAVTVLVAVAAVGLGAALRPTASFRTAVLAFQGVAVAFGALGLVAGHYVPGTIIGISLLIRLAQTSPAQFAAVPQPYLPPAEAQAAAPWAAPAPPGAVAPWTPPAPAVPAPVAPWPSSAPGPAVGSAWAVPPAAPAPWPPAVPAPVVAAVPPPPPAVPAQPVAPPPAVPSASALEQAARELAAAPPPAPVVPPATTTAPACMTILPG